LQAAGDESRHDGTRPGYPGKVVDDYRTAPI
jgi:hypothetical protein